MILSSVACFVNSSGRKSTVRDMRTAISPTEYKCLLYAAIHAIGYELVDNGLSYFNTAMATELGHFNDCDRIL